MPIRRESKTEPRRQLPANGISGEPVLKGGYFAGLELSPVSNHIGRRSRKIPRTGYVLPHHRMAEGGTVFVPSVWGKPPKKIAPPTPLSTLLPPTLHSSCSMPCVARRRCWPRATCVLPGNQLAELAEKLSRPVGACVPRRPRDRGRMASGSLSGIRGNGCFPMSRETSVSNSRASFQSVKNPRARDSCCLRVSLGALPPVFGSTVVPLRPARHRPPRNKQASHGPPSRWQRPASRLPPSHPYG